MKTNDDRLTMSKKIPVLNIPVWGVVDASTEAREVIFFDENYYQLFELLVALERRLERGRLHPRNRAGELLTTIDEVVQAILDDDMAAPMTSEEAR